ERRFGRPPARGQLEPDHPRAQTAHDLAQGVRGVVRVDGHVAADAVGVLAREGKQGIVAVRQVGGRREVGRGRAAPATQDRRHMDGDTDLLSGGEAAGVALAPAQRLLLSPGQEWQAIAAEFATPSSIYSRYILPMAAIGPIAATAGTIVFGVRNSIAGSYAMSAGDAVTSGVLEYGLNLLGVYGFAVLIEVLAPSF